MKIITINREFGSGGRELAKLLAEKLGFDYYDKEIIDEIAKETDLHPDYITKILDKSFFANYHLHYHHTFAYIAPLSSPSMKIFEEQTKILNKIAEKGENFVIVGKCADILLRKYKPIKLFVHANMESKIARCRERADLEEHLSDKEIAKNIESINKARARNHGILSQIPWGDRSGYDLIINTSNVEIESVVEPLANYLKGAFNIE